MKKLLSLLIPILLLTSCSTIIETPTAEIKLTETSTPEPTRLEPTKTPIDPTETEFPPTITTTPTNTVTPTIEETPLVLPEILLNMEGKKDGLFGVKEIMLVSSNKGKILTLAEENMDYHSATWSSKGDNFSFVRSTRRDDTQDFSELWLFDRETSEKEMIYKIESGIFLNIAWSNSDEFIAFDFLDKPRYSRYLIVLKPETGQIYLEQTISGGLTLGWSPDDQLIYSTSEQLRVFELNDDKFSYTKYISYPDFLYQVKSPEWVKFPDTFSTPMQFSETNLLGGFYLVSKFSIPLGIWSVDLSSKEWTEIIETTEYFNPIQITNGLIVCKRSGVIFNIHFTEDDWKAEPLSDDKTTCDQMKLITANKEPYISYKGLERGQHDIWIVNVSTGESFKHLNDDSLLHTYDHLDWIFYDWRPTE